MTQHGWELDGGGPRWSNQFNRLLHGNVALIGRASEQIWWDCTCMLSTHWDRVTHICARKLTIICSDNGLLPGAKPLSEPMLLIGPLGTNLSEILMEIYMETEKASMCYDIQDNGCTSLLEQISSLAKPYIWIYDRKWLSNHNRFKLIKARSNSSHPHLNAKS